MGTVERRDAILPSHINSSGWMGRERERESDEGRPCLFVFTLAACCVPDGPRDKLRASASRGKRARRLHKIQLRPRPSFSGILS